MRDDFSAKTKEILAKRVTYKCSNPDCRKPTIGPNSDPNKTVLIGVAAHITAASVGGPRYNSDLTQEERADIDNAIWLCQNCSTLIDKDTAKYSVSLLEKWKIDAEDEAFKALQQKNYTDTPKADQSRPYAEAELIWTHGFKRPQGASQKTNEIYGNTPISIMQVIWYNHIAWNYELKIYNNSSVGLFNLKLHHHHCNSFFHLKEKLPKINNLPPYRDLSLRAETSKFFEGTGEEANQIMKPHFPDQLQGLRLLLEYIGEDRKTYFTELTLNGNTLTIVHLDEKPNDY
ncbi:hypothetical protein IQ13_1042 [Lacibacter cauensis]|uniref:HNH endonuclease n=1 Tax=Lacibacter cauensis TaxID=510947 RepID=A0A562SXM6_9BACT|nr:hypothetical protein [Lacibacter cauensis]TWI85873.1 hypothetical protein IQ13_1042 [Lacibacter cauensis]